jgi:prophage maintenance system killer protein
VNGVHAAAYTIRIIRHHPLFDGNQCAGFVVGALFLEINGHNFIASEEASAQAELSPAADTLDESGFAAWLRTNRKRRSAKIRAGNEAGAPRDG